LFASAPGLRGLVFAAGGCALTGPGTRSRTAVTRTTVAGAAVAAVAAATAITATASTAASTAGGEQDTRGQGKTQPKDQSQCIPSVHHRPLLL